MSSLKVGLPFNMRIINFILFQNRSPVVNEFLSSLERETKDLGTALSRGLAASVSQIPEDLENVKTNIQNMDDKTTQTDRFVQVRGISF